jgi:hypothetical protein
MAILGLISLRIISVKPFFIFIMSSIVWSFRYCFYIYRDIAHPCHKATLTSMQSQVTSPLLGMR